MIQTCWFTSWKNGRSTELMKYFVDLDLMKSKGILLFIWSVTSILSKSRTLLCLSYEEEEGELFSKLALESESSSRGGSWWGHPLISKLISFVLRNISPSMATHFNLTLSSWKSKYTNFSNGSYKRGLQCKYSRMFDSNASEIFTSQNSSVTKSPILLLVSTLPVSASSLCSVVTVTPLTSDASWPLTSHWTRGAGRLALVSQSTVTVSPTS